MIHHVTIKILPSVKNQELDFWRALGYVRLQRTRQMGKTEWLREEVSDSREYPTSNIHLFAEDGGESKWESLEHVAITCPRGLDVAMENLDRLQFKVEAEWGEPYWGARRLFVRSPSGQRVELMEYAPVAAWSPTPDGD